MDPPLELNRNLTNWGLTYRMGDRVPRKGWAKNAFHSEQDVSSPIPPPSTNDSSTAETLQSPTASHLQNDLNTHSTALFSILFNCK